MRQVLSAAVALLLAAAMAAPTAAETRVKKKRAYTQPSSPEHGRARSDYREAIADKLPYGTKDWWLQMDREGRGGQGRPN